MFSYIIKTKRIVKKILPQDFHLARASYYYFLITIGMIFIETNGINIRHRYTTTANSRLAVCVPAREHVCALVCVCVCACVCVCL